VGSELMWRVRELFYREILTSIPSFLKKEGRKSFQEVQKVGIKKIGLQKIKPLQPARDYN